MEATGARMKERIVSPGGHVISASVAGRSDLGTGLDQGSAIGRPALIANSAEPTVLRDISTPSPRGPPTLPRRVRVLESL